MTATEIRDMVARVRRPAYATAREMSEHLMPMLLEMRAAGVPFREQQAFEREFRRQNQHEAPPQQQAA